MSRSLQYASSRAEVWRTYWRAWVRPNGLWVHHVLIGACVAALSSRTGAGHFNPQDFGVHWVLATAACLALLPLWPQIKFKKAVRSLTVDSSGFQTTIGNLSGSRSWKDIDRIEDTGREILIIGNNGNAMVVPQRAFSDAQDRKLFLQDIRSWHENNDV
jgi:hypothetical protein